MALNKNSSLQTLFEDLVNKSQSNISQFHEAINNIPGASFNIKFPNGKFRQYINKQGKSKKGFFCPGQHKGCLIEADKATNIKRHLSKCSYILNAEKPKVKLEKLNISEVKIDEDDNYQQVISVLARKMERISNNTDYGVSADSWTVKDDKGSIHTHYGCKANSIIILVNWFKTWFLQRSCSWGPTKLMKQYQGPGSKGSFMMDKELKFYYYQNSWVKLDRTEALDFIVKEFPNVFKDAFKLMDNLFIESVWFWHQKLFNTKHPKQITIESRERMNDILDPYSFMTDQEERYFNKKN